MEEERLWKFRKPQWLNSIWARNAGVYTSGALVCFSFFFFFSPFRLFRTSCILVGRYCVKKGSKTNSNRLVSPPGQFSLAFYTLLDAAVWSKSPRNGSDVHVSFVDWLPFIFSSLGMLIINSVEKSRLGSDSLGYSGSSSGVAWKARVVLFLGFACLAGGMAGGVCVFVLGYVVPGIQFPYMGMGVENVVANALVGLR